MMKITTTNAHLRPGVSHTVNGIFVWSSVLTFSLRTCVIELDWVILYMVRLLQHSLHHGVI